MAVLVSTPARRDRRSAHRIAAAGVLLVASATLLGACGPSEPPTAAGPGPASPAVQPSTVQGTALTALASLPVKGRAPKTGYSRDQFGQAWADVDRNGCDTRNDILTRDLTSTTYKPGTRNCLVLTGTLNDPYSGRQIPFTRGEATSSAIQIDHVVALSDAWQTGAQQLDTVRRTTLANDPLNLLAVDGPLNTQKSDSDAASWLPPNKSFRCTYVARQVAVKSAYALWVTQAEHDAITTVLQSCPGQLLPDGSRRP